MGVSPTKFGSSDALNGKSYATFVLRALEYDDKSGDFSWTNALEFAVEKQLISADEKKSMLDDFKRNEMVGLSYNALKSNLNGQKTSLAGKLINNGAVKREIAEKQNLIPSINKGDSLLFTIVKGEYGGLDLTFKSEDVKTLGLTPSIYGHSGSSGNIHKKELIIPYSFVIPSERSIAKSVWDKKINDEIQKVYSIGNDFSTLYFYDADFIMTHYILLPKLDAIKDKSEVNLDIIELDADEIAQQNRYVKTHADLVLQVNQTKKYPVTILELQSAKSTTKADDGSEIEQDITYLTIKDSNLSNKVNFVRIFPSSRGSGDVVMIETMVAREYKFGETIEYEEYGEFGIRDVSSSKSVVALYDSNKSMIGYVIFE
ncbi:MULTISPECIES: hypothetical protein [unclassified Fusibacter]|uniref:hypothetical protein n=1 Tax=unclassified Fusibacter TaxID=2624464 RepID=UPI00101062D0|nr:MULTISPECIES: hypothetical protein [unclassified Fusibacter]MCK8060108.1 hypothetical protein [Fusibacter sp. A2]NPE22250.1 hypothetical protein [Fusibacter sp. A1]RXV61024.1 hypothetical protein DWB64_10420 [Fusibacter sp. A1]